jgi:hypothetical protein
MYILVPLLCNSDSLRNELLGNAPISPEEFFKITKSRTVDNDDTSNDG